MSYEQYWYEDTRLLKVYYNAYKLKQRNENYSAWLNGVYTYKALIAVASAMTSENDKEPYPSEPIELFPEEKTEQQLKAERVQEALLAKAWMNNLMQIGKKWGKQSNPVTGETS